MTECAKGDGGVADVGVIGEHHLQDSNISDYWRRNGRDEEQDGSGKEKEGANVVHNACFVSHFGGSVSVRLALRCCGEVRKGVRWRRKQLRGQKLGS